MTSHSIKDCQKMMKRDISVNLNQKCLILCSKILLNVPHNTSLTVLLPWQQTGSQPLPKLKAFRATFVIGHFRNVRGLGKSMVVYHLFEKLRYSYERSTIF